MLNKSMFVSSVLFLSVFLLAPASQSYAAYLVKNGQSYAEIVIAKTASPTTVLAAKELQEYIQRISGAKLAIVHIQSGKYPNKIYVGHSTFTQKLGIANLNLQYGGFQMKSGSNWLALVGNDTPWRPPVDNPAFPVKNRQVRHHTAQKAFDKILAAKYGINYDIRPPLSQIYKYHKVHYMDSGNRKTLPKIWGFSKRGSLNAVNQFLRSLGVRWYMPGPLGEVVPEQSTIELPIVDKVVRPEFKMRWTVINRSSRRWIFRLGLNSGYGLINPAGLAHGLSAILNSKKLKEQHPDYYALWGGKRMNGNHPQPDLSSPGLFKLTVDYVNALFDIYPQINVVSIMPPDAYIRMPEGPGNKGKASPELGPSGLMSNYVWGFVNRVAKEVYKTHPDKYVSCIAYNRYVQPPDDINKFSPNLLIGIKNGRPKDSGQKTLDEKTKLYKAWKAKTPNNIFVPITYHFTQRGYYLPAYFPYNIARGLALELKMSKGMALGEFIGGINGKYNGRWGLDAPGFNHLNVWLTARLYWSAHPEKDVDKLLNDYYHKFYGPAANQMKAYVDYCRQYYQELGGGHTAQQRKQVIAKINHIFALLRAAQHAVKPDSKYAKRIAMVQDYLKKLGARRDQLMKMESRGKVRTFTYMIDTKWRDLSKYLVMDGKLDGKFWTDYLHGAALLKIGGKRVRKKNRRTLFYARWGKNNMYFGILCPFDPNDPPIILTKKNQDKEILSGDFVEIDLETDKHSYYQIAINPAGAVLGRDCGASKARGYDWRSMAQVATYIGKDYWSAEIKIPVTTSDQDPLHEVVGDKPTGDIPWYFNIIRVNRHRDGSQPTITTFAPVDLVSQLHDPSHFGKLVEHGSRHRRK